jgi:hypothetical protein
MARRHPLTAPIAAKALMLRQVEMVDPRTAPLGSRHIRHKACQRLIEVDSTYSGGGAQRRVIHLNAIHRLLV